jgi:multiple sugar transport system substrate-binding protein
VRNLGSFVASRRDFLKQMGVAAATAPAAIRLITAKGSSGWSASRSASKSVTLRCLFQAGDQTAPQAKLQSFVNANPHVTVQFIEANYDVMYQKMLAGLTSNAYDLVEPQCPWIGDYASANLIENLDSYFNQYAKQINVKDYILNGTYNRNKYNGHWYGVPYDNDFPVLYYRKDLLDDPASQSAFQAQYGYALAPPDTWDQALDIGKYFQKTGKVQAGFATLSGVNWQNPAWWYDAYGSYGGLWVKDGKYVLDREPFLKAADTWAQLIAIGGPGGANMSGNDLTGIISGGQTVQGLFFASTAVLDSAPSGVELAVAMVPGVKQSDGSVLRTPGLGAGKTLAIATTSPNKTDAFKLAMWMSSPQMQATETTMLTGVDPNRYSVFEIPAVKQLWDPMLSVTEETLKIGVPMADIKNAYRNYNAFAVQLSAMYTGQITASQAYDNILAGWTQAGSA